MNLKTYPSSHGDGSFSADEIRRGYHWVHTDIECPHCGKNQPVAATSYIGGPCVGCGKLTSGVDGDPDRAAQKGAVVAMSDTKHTPGPLHVIAPIRDDQCYGIVDSNLDVVAYVGIKGRPNGANAQLFAAASDLFEAAVAYVDNSECSCLESMDLRRTCLHCEFKAAIAKATGSNQ